MQIYKGIQAKRINVIKKIQIKSVHKSFDLSTTVKYWR